MDALNQHRRPGATSGASPGEGMTRETWLHRAIEALRPRFEQIGMPLSGKIHVSVGFGYGSRAESKHILGQCWARCASADGVNHVSSPR